MSFLRWLRQNKEGGKTSQLDLFGDSQELNNYKRVDGATVNKDLNKTIKEKGGTGTVYPDCANAMCESLFDMKPDELYKATGAKKNQRSTLPKEAQKAFISGEAIANYELREQDIQGTSSQKNQQIVRSVSNSGRKVRKLLPW